MEDNRYEILEALVDRLTPIGLPVYSVVPQDFTKPYIYIGDLFFETLDNKDAFLLGGVLTVELLTGSNEWIGSISVPLSWWNDIKLALKPRKRSVLIPKMVYMRMSLDTGIEQMTSTARNYIGTLQYEFQLQQGISWADQVCAYVQRVLSDGGTIESIECVSPECTNPPTIPDTNAVTHKAIDVYNNNILVTHNN